MTNPRRRTVERMQGLLALAASAGLGACSRTPPGDAAPAAPPEGTSSTSSSRNGKAQASSVPALTASVTPRPPGHGYAVVDPMPPPARCAGLAGSISVKTRWKDETTLVLALSKPKLAQSAYDTSTAPTIHPATCAIEKRRMTAASAAFEIHVARNTKSFRIVLGAICPQGKQQIVVSIGSSSPALSKDAKLHVFTTDLHTQ